MTTWENHIQRWRRTFEVRTFPPIDLASLARAKDTLEGLPVELEELYRVSNGLSAGSFKLLPVESAGDIKRTWDSVSRANDARATRFLSRSAELLLRFLVFADIGVGRCAAFDRKDGSIWYEEDGQLHQTNLSLMDFIETNLREASSA